MVLFSAVIHKRRGKKLVAKQLKMQFGISYPKDIHNFFWKTVDFVENLEMMQIALEGKERGRGRGGSCSLHHYGAMRMKIDM